MQEPLPVSGPVSETEEGFALSGEQVKVLDNFIKLAGLMLQTRWAELFLYNPKIAQLLSFRTYQANASPRRTGRDRSRETRPLSPARLKRAELIYNPLPTEVIPSANKNTLSIELFERLATNTSHNEGFALSYPVMVNGQPFAFFRAEEREDGQSYGEREQQMLELLVGQLLSALHLESSGAESEATTHSNGQFVLPGEEYLQAQLPGELERARRHNFNLTLMSLGIDILQTGSTDSGEINQAYLQEVSQYIARMLRRILRSFDLVCQYNDGTEFSIVLPHTNEIEGYYVTNKLISYFEDNNNLKRAISRNVSLSVGLSTYPILASSAPVLVKQARQALAQARKTKNKQHPIYIWGSSRHFDLSKLEDLKSDEAVARAMLRGFGWVSLTAENTSILPNAIPWDISRQHLCLAVQERQAVLTVAMADPSDSSLITLLARTTGRSIVPMVARRSEIEAALAALDRQRQSL